MSYAIFRLEGHKLNGDQVSEIINKLHTITDAIEGDHDWAILIEEENE